MNGKEAVVYKRRELANVNYANGICDGCWFLEELNSIERELKRIMDAKSPKEQQ